jgi:TIR domain
LVHDLARRLRDAGLKSVVDLTDLPVAANWRKTVREQIRRADAMLILVTPAALKYDWMMTELGMAEGFNRVVIPVSAGLKPRDFPAPLQTYQVTPFDRVDGAISKLAEKLTAAATNA